MKRLKGADGRPRIHIRPVEPRSAGVSWQIGPTGIPFLADSIGEAVNAAVDHFDQRHGIVIFWEPYSFAPGAGSDIHGA